MRRAEWQEETGLSFPNPSPYDPGPPDPLLFSAAYEVRYDDLVTGSDAATVAFVEGWLVVDGRRASFALRPCDVSVKWDGSMVIAGGGWLRFDGHDRPAAFEGALAFWCREPSPEGEPVFPPARVHPARVARATTRAAGGIPLFIGAVFVAGTSWVGNVASFALTAIGVAFVYAGWSTAERLRSRDRFVLSRSGPRRWKG